MNHPRNRIRIFLAFVLFVIALNALSAGGTMDSNQVAHDQEAGGRTELAPCPSTPNCVSTAATDRMHAIEPLPVAGTTAETMAIIESVVRSMVRTRIITTTESYLHAEYRTRLGFVDDVEFLINTDGGSVEFRSASRVGMGDLGVNRRRMEEFRSRYAEISP